MTEHDCLHEEDWGRVKAQPSLLQVLTVALALVTILAAVFLGTLNQHASANDASMRQAETRIDRVEMAVTDLRQDISNNTTTINENNALLKKIDRRMK